MWRLFFCIMLFHSVESFCRHSFRCECVLRVIVLIRKKYINVSYFLARNIFKKIVGNYDKIKAYHKYFCVNCKVFPLTTNHVKPNNQFEVIQKDFWVRYKVFHQPTNSSGLITKLFLQPEEKKQQLQSVYPTSWGQTTKISPHHKKFEPKHKHFAVNYKVFPSTTKKIRPTENISRSTTKFFPNRKKWNQPQNILSQPQS